MSNFTGATDALVAGMEEAFLKHEIRALEKLLESGMMSERIGKLETGRLYGMAKKSCECGAWQIEASEHSDWCLSGRGVK